MVKHDAGPETDRRTYIAALGTGLAAGLAGCAGGNGGGEGGTTNGSGGGGSGEWNETLEVLHGWSGGDGEAAVSALIEAFNEEYPDMETNFQAVGASANVNLNATILRRMVNNNPMSSFANWPGNNLERYRGHLMDLEKDVWEAEGYKDVMQDRAVELCTFNDKMPTVPLGSHRMNNLFYNIKVFEDAGVDPKSLDSMDALLSALKTIQEETDVTPMGQAMKAPWTVLQLWAQVLMSQSGVDAYTKFIEGNGDKQKIVEALKTVKDIQQNYITSDASSVSFTDVGGKMINGEVACMHQGNWLAGQFRSNDSFNYQEHWGWIPFPGTEGVYCYHLDSIVAPMNNPSKEETIAWEKFVGTKKAQIAFNNLKGSVPLRTDIDPSELSDFIAMTYKDLTSSEKYPPTIAHGLAVPPEQMGNCKTAMSEHMMGPYDVNAAADALLKAVSG
ncbi:ABC transporter substrate-binding protein [Halopelagius longus]|uniref:Carbohydrate ABC transporter substrate-binding protein n=1 Tax=Halopelagius longus TaxID=1236180 RepID=A0A1H1FPD5_9EURY|nr:ABC transporter substrate-binding protein [Halopelagius longus]RDI70014.1 carbohydrate ABC transporter substrate-binding protein [Halopelagius longus]SDR02406.1 carbohydrate ABC transporter substrate-binding protein, CUT1 family [Halopelagius longus]